MGFRGRAQGPAPTITVGDKPLCVSGGTTGDVVTSAVDDYNKELLGGSGLSLFQVLTILEQRLGR